MTTNTDRIGIRRLSILLRQELVLDPARVRWIARIAGGAAIVTIVAMLFRIPLAAYSAYLVFLLSREDAPSTLKTSVGGLLAATVALDASILLYVIDAAEPAIRIPLLFLSTFTASYLARSVKLGPVARLAGFVLVLTQTLADETAHTEALTRSVLWLWVVVAVPALVTTLLALCCAPARPHRPDSADRDPAQTRSDDALASRTHARFALKVACAVLASYVTYTLLDWPGIRTAVTTCFFVSLGTAGERIHRLTLRLTGALIGGLLGGLCIVFVMPYLTDIGQLCAVIIVVSALCAWISTSSETIAYAGMQMAFAFFLGVMQGDGPAYDLTVLRDRVVGIAIGNIWMSIVFATLTPTHTIARRPRAHSTR